KDAVRIELLASPDDVLPANLLKEKERVNDTLDEIRRVADPARCQIRRVTLRLPKESMTTEEKVEAFEKKAEDVIKANEERYGVTPVRFASTEGTELQLVAGYFHLRVLSGDGQEIIALYERAVREGREVSPVVDDLEFEIVFGIQGIWARGGADVKRPTVGLYVGQDGFLNRYPRMRELVGELQRFYRLVDVKLTEYEPLVPEEVDTLIVAAPGLAEIDYSGRGAGGLAHRLTFDEKAVYAIDQFLSRPSRRRGLNDASLREAGADKRNLILMLDRWMVAFDPEEGNPKSAYRIDTGLDAYLAHLGLRLTDEMVAHPPAAAANHMWSSLRRINTPYGPVNGYIPTEIKYPFALRLRGDSLRGKFVEKLGEIDVVFASPVEVVDEARKKKADPFLVSASSAVTVPSRTSSDYRTDVIEWVSKHMDPRSYSPEGLERDEKFGGARLAVALDANKAAMQTERQPARRRTLGVTLEGTWRSIYENPATETPWLKEAKKKKAEEEKKKLESKDEKDETLDPEKEKKEREAANAPLVTDAKKLPVIAGQDARVMLIGSAYWLWFWNTGSSGATRLLVNACNQMMFDSRLADIQAKRRAYEALAVAPDRRNAWAAFLVALMPGVVVVAGALRLTWLAIRRRRFVATVGR
ncbi:MAG: GldG family protein, partial [Planctomycetes bacterium]|nr:GldG family protein [Planctomycetota bacterium]